MSESNGHPNGNGHVRGQSSPGWWQSFLDRWSPWRRRIPPAPRPVHVVFLAIPNAGSIMPCCFVSADSATRNHKRCLAPLQFGDIPHNFNQCWTAALTLQEKEGYTHFAMAHTDIRPQEGWLDILLDEMDRVDADIMSTVIAIKDHRGLTTTGLRRPGIWGSRRFTMREIFALPETFSIDDIRDPAIDPPNELLAINTGLWVCRFPRGGWPTKFPGFRSEHRIRWRDGEPVPEFDSEDWLFSEWAALQGLRVFATRKVEAYHIGAFEYGNNTVWGQLQTDHWRPKYPSLEAEAEAEAQLRDLVLDHLTGPPVRVG